MDLDTAITAWEQDLTRQTGLAASTITQYVRDARRFAAWLADYAPASTLAEVVTGDARDYRDALLAAGRAPATINVSANKRWVNSPRAARPDAGASTGPTRHSA